MNRRAWLLMSLLAALWGASYLFIKVALEDGLDPIFIALIAARFDDDERPHGIATAGVVMGIVGVVLLFGIDLSGDAQALAGGLMVLLATVGYAVGPLYIKHRLRGVPPVSIAASTMAAGTLVLLPFALFTLPTRMPDVETVGAMVALGAGGTGIAV